VSAGLVRLAQGRCWVRAKNGARNAENRGEKGQLEASGRGSGRDARTTGWRAGRRPAVRGVHTGAAVDRIRGQSGGGTAAGAIQKKEAGPAAGRFFQGFLCLRHTPGTMAGCATRVVGRSLTVAVLIRRVCLGIQREAVKGRKLRGVYHDAWEQAWSAEPGVWSPEGRRLLDFWTFDCWTGSCLSFLSVSADLYCGLNDCRVRISDCGVRVERPSTQSHRGHKEHRERLESANSVFSVPLC
jgi:hypothetical protein